MRQTGETFADLKDYGGIFISVLCLSLADFTVSLFNLTFSACCCWTFKSGVSDSHISEVRL